MSGLDIYLFHLAENVRMICIISGAAILFAAFWKYFVDEFKPSGLWVLTAWLMLITGFILPSKQTLAEMFLVPRINAGLSTEGMPPELAAVWQKFTCDYLDDDCCKSREKKNGTDRN